MSLVVAGLGAAGAATFLHALDRIAPRQASAASSVASVHGGTAAQRRLVRATLGGLGSVPILAVRLGPGVNTETRRRGTEITLVVPMPPPPRRRLAVDQLDRATIAWYDLEERRTGFAALVAGGVRDRAQRARLAPVVEWAVVFRTPGRRDSRNSESPLQAASGVGSAPPPPASRPASLADARRLRDRVLALARARRDTIERLAVRRPYGLALELALRPHDPRLHFCEAVRAYTALVGFQGDPFVLGYDGVDLRVVGYGHQEPWRLQSTPRVGQASGPSDPCSGEQGAVVTHARPIPARTDAQCVAILRALGLRAGARARCRGAHRRPWLRLAVANHNADEVVVYCTVTGANRHGRVIFRDRHLNPAQSTFAGLPAKRGTQQIDWFLEGGEHRVSRLTADCEILRTLPT